MRLTSNTVVKNGMPFVPLIIRQALPFVDRAIITISEKSSDGTKEALLELQAKNPKIEIFYENVASQGELTAVEQHQIDISKTDWIWFLSDDDYWEPQEIEKCLLELEDDIDGLSVNPYQILGPEHEDSSWIGCKYFTKFFRKKGANYRGNWPNEMIYMDDTLLYHKTNPRDKAVPHKFFHLAEVKNYSFRNHDLTEYKYRTGSPSPLSSKLPKDILTILKNDFTTSCRKKFP